MTDLERLHRAILADPADDVARLAYADELEATGDNPRADFIRLQVELSRRSQPDPVAGSVLGGTTVALYGVMDNLARDYSWQWLGSSLRDYLGKCDPALPGPLWQADWCDSSAEFRRGLVDSVRLPLNVFLHMRHKLFVEHPITQVSLDGCSPLDSGRLEGYLSGIDEIPTGRWYWVPRSRPLEGSELARWELPGWLDLNWSDGYPSEAEAYKAASLACVRDARFVVGLPAEVLSD